MGITSKDVREKRKKKATEAAAARKAKQKHKEEIESRVDSMYEKADPSGSSHLDKEGIGRLIQLLNEEDGEAPLDETTLQSAVSFVFKAADKDASGGVDKTELPAAIAAWDNWARTHDALSERVKAELKEIDKDFSGSLDRDELKDLLIKLNGDMIVTDTIINQIIKKCDKRGNGVIDIEELAPAMTMWYQMVDDGKVEAKNNDGNEVTNKYGPDDAGTTREEGLKKSKNCCCCI